MRVSQPSFQSLYIEMRAFGRSIACGTAFVVSSKRGKHFLITNRHNVTGRNQDTGRLISETAAVPDEIIVWHNSSEGLGKFRCIPIPILFEDKAQWIEHPVLKEIADVVAIPLMETSEVSFYSYKIEDAAYAQVAPAQPVSVVGFPFGERTGASFAVWATGFVASEPETDHDGRPVFLIDCRTRQGQSGSPVVRHHSSGGVIEHENGVEVITSSTWLLGIYSGRINKDSDLGTVWKAHVISELVEYATGI
jgi:hypothetical protein